MAAVMSKPVFSSHRLQKSLALWCAWIILIMIAGPLQAESKESVMYWAKKVQHAAQTVSYVGTCVQTFGDQTLLSKVVHHAPSDTDVTESLFGEPLISLRQGNQIQKYYPNRNLLLFTEQSHSDKSKGGAFPALNIYIPDSAEKYYKIAAVEKQACLKMLCDVITIQAKDSKRMSRRWWIDEKYGLLIKEQILSEKNTVLEEIAFSEIRFDETKAMEMLENRPKPSATYVQRKVSTSDVMQAHQSKNASILDGFSAISLFKRDKSQDGDLLTTESHRGRSWQWVLSDGLTSISVFVEIPNKKFSGVLQNNKGATQMLSVMRDMWMVTAMGNAPFATLQHIAEDLPLH